MRRCQRFVNVSRGCARASAPRPDEVHDDHCEPYAARRDGEHVEERVHGDALVVAELGEALLVDAEGVCELVQDGDPDLALELDRVAELLG